MTPAGLEAAIEADLAAGLSACRRHRERRRHQHRRNGRHCGGRRHRAQARALPPCRRRLGRLGHDLPGVPAFLGRAWRKRIRWSSIRTNGWARSSTAPCISSASPKTWCGRSPSSRNSSRPMAATAIVNYSEWTVPLGRRFRALKLWFLLRAHGLEGLREMIRNHVRWSENLASRLAAVPGFEIVTEPMLSLFTFRHQARDEGRDRRAQSGAGERDQRRWPHLPDADARRRPRRHPVPGRPVRDDRGGCRHCLRRHHWRCFRRLNGHQPG